MSGIVPIERKVDPVEYPSILRWGIKSGYAYVEKLTDKNKYNYYIRGKIAFLLSAKSMSPLDIIIYENEVKSPEDLDTFSFLAFTSREWLVKGSWEYDVDAYFHNLKQVKLGLEADELTARKIYLRNRQRKLDVLIKNTDEEYISTLKPTITLLGRDPMESHIGVPYLEYGAYAYDLYRQDITNNIEIDDSNVDIKKLGTYSVIYKVTDSYGNRSSVVRKVTIT